MGGVGNKDTYAASGWRPSNAVGGHGSCGTGHRLPENWKGGLVVNDGRRTRVAFGTVAPHS